MENFSNINEEEFLKGYAGFTVEIRPFIIKKLVEEYRSTTNKNEKEMLFLLTVEQSFLFFETFVGLFQAIRNRNQKPLIQSLNKDINIQNLFESLKKKTAKAILSELNLPIEHLAPDIQKQINERFDRLTSLFQKDKFYYAMKNLLIPIFNKLKHKMLLYKNNQGEVDILDENIKNQLSKYKTQNNENFPLDNIDFLFDIAERFKYAIQDLIYVRLIELQK